MYYFYYVIFPRIKPYAKHIYFSLSLLFLLLVILLIINNREVF